MSRTLFAASPLASTSSSLLKTVLRVNGFSKEAVASVGGLLFEATSDFRISERRSGVCIFSASFQNQKNTSRMMSAGVLPTMSTFLLLLVVASRTVE